MHPLDQLDEAQLRELTIAVLDAIKARLPDRTAFAVLFWPFGGCEPQYGSNCRRGDMIQALRECADRLESRSDVPR